MWSWITNHTSKCKNESESFYITIPTCFALIHKICLPLEMKLKCITCMVVHILGLTLVKILQLRFFLLLSALTGNKKCKHRILTKRASLLETSFNLQSNSYVPTFCILNPRFSAFFIIKHFCIATSIIVVGTNHFIF